MATQAFPSLRPTKTLVSLDSSCSLLPLSVHQQNLSAPSKTRIRNMSASDQTLLLPPGLSQRHLLSLGLLKLCLLKLHRSCHSSTQKLPVTSCLRVKAKTFIMVVQSARPLAHPHPTLSPLAHCSSHTGLFTFSSSTSS